MSKKVQDKSKEPDFSLKLTGRKVVMGGQCGKSTYCVRFVNGFFDTDPCPTVETTFHHAYNWNGEEIRLDILDTSGDFTCYAALHEKWCKFGDGIIVMYNVSMKQSIEEAVMFYNSVIKYRKPNAPLMLVGTGIDEKKRATSTEEGKQLAEKWNVPFFEVSALTGENVEASMREMLNLLVEAKKNAAAVNDKSTKKNKPPKEKKEKPPKEKKDKPPKDKKEKKEKKQPVPQPNNNTPPESKDLTAGNLSIYEDGQWISRWFEMEGGVLYELDAKGGKLIKSTNIFGVEMKEYEPNTVNNAFQLVKESVQIILKADSTEEMQLWLNSILKQTMDPTTNIQRQTQQSKQEMEARQKLYEKVMKQSKISVSQKYFSVKDYAEFHDENKRFRKSMEDEVVTLDCFGGNKDRGYFAVYDGHGGRRVVELVKQHLHENILKLLENDDTDIKEVLKTGFLSTADQILKEIEPDKDRSGSTALVCLVTWKDDKYTIHIANVGDTRAVLCRDGKAVRVSQDHNAATNEAEVQRIKDMGGFVIMKKVGGTLSVTRAFGNLELAKYVQPDPHITEIVCTQADTHLILACDGVWDVIDDQEAVDLILTEESPQQMTEKLVKTAIEKRSKDNVSAIVLQLGSYRTAWSEFVNKLENHITPEIIQREFEVAEALANERPQVLTSDALAGGNREKNRYVNILPFNATRVKLSVIDGNPSSDYINASYVNTGKAVYVATQAPLPHTVPDFWRMVWEKHTSLIIMLTRYVELGTIKAVNYFPDIEDENSTESQTYGDITVTHVSKHSTEHFDVTVLKLTKKDETRHVTHYHYLSWPDHGVPKPESMLEMMEAVQKEAGDKSTPQLVHCSAGIGRTGTWIAISTLLEELDQAFLKGSPPTLNLLKTLDDLRNQRPGMMTSIDQYEFTYKTVLAHAKQKLQALEDAKKQDNNSKPTPKATSAPPSKAPNPNANSTPESPAKPSSGSTTQAPPTPTKPAPPLNAGKVLPSPPTKKPPAPPAKFTKSVSSPSVTENNTAPSVKASAPPTPSSETASPASEQASSSSNGSTELKQRRLTTPAKFASPPRKTTSPPVKYGAIRRLSAEAPPAPSSLSSTNSTSTSTTAIQQTTPVKPQSTPMPQNSSIASPKKTYQPPHSSLPSPKKTYQPPRPPRPEPPKKQ